MGEADSAVLIMKLMLRTLDMIGYAVNNGITGFLCYSWTRARTRGEIELARNRSITGIAAMGLYGGMSAVFPTMMARAYRLETEPSTFIRMIPAYIMVLAMFTTRDPLTHSIAWGTSLICVVMIVSNVLTPGGALARTTTTAATIMLGAHAAILMTARTCRQGPAPAITPGNAATLLGLDAGATAYLIFLMSSW